MPISILPDPIIFPPVDQADSSGILAIGGHISAESLKLAYSSGVFPWFDSDSPTPVWWAPPERMILIPGRHHVSKSMRSILNKNLFELRIDSCFTSVLDLCANPEVRGGDDTWITDELKQAYLDLHGQGLAKSFEVFYEGQLVGGLFGVISGKIFHGESMFSLKSNSSKFAFIKLSEYLLRESFILLECQNYTEHLASLGCTTIGREQYMAILRKQHI